MCINCETVTNCYYKQLKRKEQECEELKNKLTKSIFEDGKKQIALDIAIYERDKLKATLTEIKEIAEWHTTKADNEDVQEDMKQILQKISEVEE